MLNSGKLLFTCLALLLVAGQALAFPGNAPAPAGAPTAAPAATQAPAASTNITKGKIVETMNAGGYTYLCLENGGQKSWAAVRETPVKVGDEVQIADGAVMRNFTSKTLGRTFDAIIFSQGIISQ